MTATPHWTPRILGHARTLLSTFGAALLLTAAAAGCTETGEPFQAPPDAPNVDLRVLVTSNFTSRVQGEQVIFTVRVTNLGPIAATGVIAADTLPTGLTYQSHTTSFGTYSPSTGLWGIGALGVNSEVTLAITATIAATSGQLANRAAVVSTDFNDSVTTNNVAEASVTVGTLPPPPVGVFFQSDWSTATGNSDNAISDGGKWNSLLCQQRAQTLSVVPASSVGFTRSTNVLRLQQLGTTCGTLERTDAVPQSTSHWGRMYFRNDENSTQHNHVVTYNPLGDIQVAFWNRGGTASGLRVFIRNYYRSNGQPSQYPTNFWSPTTFLQHGVWYRYEWHMEYVTSTTYRIWPRVYDMAGTLLLDASNYFENDASPTSGRTLAAHYAAGNTFGFSNVAAARRIGLGNEGPPGSPNNGLYWYHANLALSTSGWIGQ